VSPDVANALGLTVDEARRTKVQELIAGAAKDASLDVFDYLVGLGVDSPEDQKTLRAERVQDQRRALGPD